MSNYKIELRARIKTLQKKIVLQEKRVETLKFRTDKWWEEHRNLNSLRIDLETVKSRFKNLGKNYGGIEPIKIITSNNNTTNQNY